MKISVLSLAYLRENETYKDSFDAMIRLAQKTEQLGYERFWIAEHHNMRPVGSSAPQILIQHVLAHTEKIRVGSGGIMLPNHNPFLIAEQFGTLETLYPNRVDLGLGRAPGTDQKTSRALRRTSDPNPYFPENIAELEGYFKDTNSVSAYPAAGINVPFYILGSSVESAYLAADLGLPYAFASHFAPQMMEEAIAIYRNRFKPSDVLAEPYVMVGANVIIADTDKEAEKLATSQTQTFLQIITNEQHGLRPPVEDDSQVWRNFIKATKVPHFGPIALEHDSIIDGEKSIVNSMMAYSFIGSPETVKEQIKASKDLLGFDEIIVNSYIYDEQALHHSFELLAEITKELNND